MRRLALFDLDNTLIDRPTVFRRWATQFRRSRAGLKAAKSLEFSYRTGR